MQGLITFYDDYKPIAIALAAVALLVVIGLLFLLYRMVFGRRLRAAGNGRVRQPRLGIVDAYDLDRQRQLVLVRRDNVEHLIMIGGPTDVVIESAIVRAQQQPLRDKEPGPAIGPMPTPTVLPASPQAPSIAAAPQAPSLVAPLQTRTEPPLTPPRPAADRPAQERPVNDRPQPRPAAPVDGRVEPSPLRAGGPNGTAARPPGPPPQPARGGSPTPIQMGGAAGAGPVGPSSAISSPDTSSVSGTSAARPPLPQRVPPRQPLPPRPAPGSSLPSRPPRPLPPRAEPPLRADPTARPMSPDGPPPVMVAGPTSMQPGATASRSGSVADPEPRSATAPPVQTASDSGPRRVEPPPLSADPAPPALSGRAETLESLEEEMAKLLGRPIPRRDG